MIYFDKPTKEALIGKFFQNLSNGGIFIGHAESLTGIKHHLKYIQSRVYQKIEGLIVRNWKRETRAEKKCNIVFIH